MVLKPGPHGIVEIPHQKSDVETIVSLNLPICLKMRQFRLQWPRRPKISQKKKTQSKCEQQ